MENTVIKHTFLKFDQSEKKKIFNKNPRTPDKTKKNRSSEKNQQWQHWRGASTYARGVGV